MATNEVIEAYKILAATMSDSSGLSAEEAIEEAVGLLGAYLDNQK